MDLSGLGHTVQYKYAHIIFGDTYSAGFQIEESNACYWLDVISTLSLAILFFKFIDSCYKGYIKKKKSDVKRKYKKLSEKQKQLLDETYETESREFYINRNLESKHWFEELSEWNM